MSSVVSGPLDDVIENAVGVHEAKYRWGDASPADLISAAVKHIGHDPNAVCKYKDDDGNWIEKSVDDIIPDHLSMPNAVRRLRNQADNVGSGQDKRDIISYAAWKYMKAEGQFFQLEDGTVYYFYDEEKRAYRLTGDGGSEVSADFRALLHELTGLSTGKDGRVVLTQIHDRAKRQAPEREAHKFAAWDEDGHVLYVTDFNDGYYRLDGDSIEHRDNGEDVFFLDYNGAPYEYLDPSERADFSGGVPGELSRWHNRGDLLMRFFGNRTNFDPAAILSKDQQRTQMYVHLHAMAFINYFTAKPITAFVGEKGSGKTVIQRSIGKFLFGGDWKESMMPSEREDFAAIVNNRPLAFVDNFDQGVDWANDILASTATGSADIRRELFTTMDMKQTTPDCFIALTSRDPPFRRDDVADRTVVFRVTRLDNFIGMRGFLNPVAENRDSLWSVYLDNLNEIVDEMAGTDMGSMVSTHRMSDWAAFAKVVGEALDLDGVDGTLEVMQKERALFALEDDTLFRTLREWLNDPKSDARGVEWSAGDLLTELQEYADDNNIDFTYQRSSTLGKRLGNITEELDELFGFEVDESGRTKKYKFIDPNSAGGKQGVLGYGHFDSDDDDDGGGSESGSADNGSGDGESEQSGCEAPDPDGSESDGDDPSDGGKSQNERLSRIKSFVSEREAEYDDGVPREMIMNMLANEGFRKEMVGGDIDTLLQKGEMYEPSADGKYYTT